MTSFLTSLHFLARGKMTNVNSELDWALSHLFQPVKTNTLQQSHCLARLQPPGDPGFKFHNLTVWPDVPLTVSYLRCNRWALASHSLLARRCAQGHTHTCPQKHRKTTDGFSLSENEIPLTPPAEHNILRFARVKESVVFWILSNVVFSLL